MEKNKKILEGGERRFHSSSRPEPTTDPPRPIVCLTLWEAIDDIQMSLSGRFATTLMVIGNMGVYMTL